MKSSSCLPAPVPGIGRQPHLCARWVCSAEPIHGAALLCYATPKAIFFCSFGSHHCVSSRVQIPSWSFRGSRAGLQRRGGSKGQRSSSLHDGLLLLPTPSHETLHSDKSALCNAKVFVQKRCFSPENSTFNGRLQEGGGAAR